MAIADLKDRFSRQRSAHRCRAGAPDLLEALEPRLMMSAAQPLATPPGLAEMDCQTSAVAIEVEYDQDVSMAGIRGDGLARQSVADSDSHDTASIVEAIATAAPLPPIDVRLAPGSDTGQSDTDGITKERRPEIIWEGHGETDIVDYEVCVDGTVFLVTGTRWVCPSDYSEGTHTVSVRARDGTGELSAPATYEFMTDYTGPRVLSHSPSGTIPRSGNEIVLTFNEPIAEATIVRYEDVDVRARMPSDWFAIVPPVPVISSMPITGINAAGGNSFRVSYVGLRVPTQYWVFVGPHIEDLAGNEMDQDRRTFEGAPYHHDMYCGTFTVADSEQSPLSGVCMGVPTGTSANIAATVPADAGDLVITSIFAALANRAVPRLGIVPRLSTFDMIDGQPDATMQEIKSTHDGDFSAVDNCGYAQDRPGTGLAFARLAVDGETSDSFLVETGLTLAELIDANAIQVDPAADDLGPSEIFRRCFSDAARTAEEQKV